MAKKDHSSATWADEIEKHGWVEAMKSRLAFHGGLDVDWVSRYTGRCHATVRRLFKRLVDMGVAIYDDAHPGHIRMASKEN